MPISQGLKKKKRKNERNQQLHCDTQIACSSTECMTLKNIKQLSTRQNSSWKNNDPKQWIVNVTNEKVLELVLEQHKCGFVINIYVIQMMAMETAISLKTTQQDFISCKGYAFIFMHFKGYTLHQRSISAKSFPQPNLSCERWMAEDFMAEQQKQSIGQMTKFSY